jgi:hypothetical protein
MKSSERNLLMDKACLPRYDASHKQLKQAAGIIEAPSQRKIDDTFHKNAPQYWGNFPRMIYRILNKIPLIIKRNLRHGLQSSCKIEQVIRTLAQSEISPAKFRPEL